MASSGEDSWSCDVSISAKYDHVEQTASDLKLKKEQKRRPKPKDGTMLLCVVCGDRALGYNFDVVSCESCKAFFRRNALKAKSFTCSFDGNCKLDSHTRKFCSGCRLKKCLSSGMKKDWILSDEELSKRRERRKYRSLSEQDVYPQVVTCSQTSSNEVTTNYHSDDHSSPSSSNLSSSSPKLVFAKTEQPDEQYPCPMSDEMRANIENMTEVYSTIFDAPYTNTQVSKLTTEDKTTTELFNLTDIFIRRLIRWSKLLPEFKVLSQEDQISLLKGGIMEIFVLRSAMGFDDNKQQWKYKTADGQKNSLDPDVIKKSISKDMYLKHMHFVKCLREMTRSDRVIMVLLFIIELFSPDRHGLVNKLTVSQGQEKYSMWLKAYLESVNSVFEAHQLYPKLLLMLRDVRSLGEESAMIASKLDIGKLDPLLREVFSMS
ncbi:nuclear hormone receptor HR96-like [Gigantopelta aegis]|uniref:nuclear hormone receptor HR96-like n=1 Tax=Gigantopelta aegis TaxID=1735272 RepID=UPI001B88BBB4|nr:nuclear hormone receptor HR96-like [Gigantopelta aegis]